MSGRESDGEKKGLLSSDKKRYGGEEVAPPAAKDEAGSAPGSKTGSLERDVIFSPSYEKVRPRNYDEDAGDGTPCTPRPRLLLAALAFFIVLSIVLTILLVLFGTGVINHQQGSNVTSRSTPLVVQAQLTAAAVAPAAPESPAAPAAPEAPAAPAAPLPRLASIFDYEKEAQTTLSPGAWSYFSSGSMEEITLRDNVAAYRRLRLHPVRQVDVSNADSSLKVSTPGGQVALPIGFSPTASHWWANKDGENATARAAENLGTVMIVSIDATVTTPEIAAAAPGALLWQQLYIFKHLNDTQYMIDKAERSGCKAIVLTIDKPAESIRYSPLRGLEPYPSDMPNMVNYPKPMASDSGYYKNRSWEEITWLTKHTALPIIVKGVLRASEARQAIDHGASAILVSNHGGRALDGVPATIDQLAEVVAEVNGAVPVYLDGGIRTGADVFKALALGADMVFVGRPVLWGLAHDGQKGVEDVISILKKEFINTMQLAGAANMSSISPDLIYRQKFMPV